METYVLIGFVYKLTQQTTTDTTLKYFQNKIQHRILATYTFLTNIGIKHDKKSADETLSHLFFNVIFLLKKMEISIRLGKIQIPSRYNL